MFGKKIIFLLTLALVFRIILMLWSFQHVEHKDILRFRDWAIIPYLYSLTDPYEGKHLTFGISPLNLPPGTLYIVTSMYRLNLQAAKLVLKITHTKPGELIWVNIELTNAFLRFPNILGDILTGYLIYLLVAKFKDQRNALFASGLFLFNPSIFYNSSFWGQMDAINNALFFLAIFLFYSGKKFLTITFLFLSLYVKLTLIFLAGPILLLMFWLEKNKIKFVFYLAAVVILILLATIPVSPVPHIWFYQFFQKNSLGEMNNITSLAFNFWWVIFKPRIIIGDPTSEFNFTQDRFVGSPPSSAVYFGMPLFVWALITLIIVSLPLIKIIFTQKEKILKPNIMFLLLSLMSLLAYLFLPHMHERYLFPFISLMATSIGLTNKYFWIFIGISLLNFLNIFIIWHPILQLTFTYSLINNENFQWFISLLTVVLSVVLYVGIYMHLKRGLPVVQNKNR